MPDTLPERSFQVRLDRLLPRLIDLSHGRFEHGVDGAVVRYPQFGTVVRFQPQGTFEQDAICRHINLVGSVGWGWRAESGEAYLSKQGYGPFRSCRSRPSRCRCVGSATSLAPGVKQSKRHDTTRTTCTSAYDIVSKRYDSGVSR
jgi:hypothetical protein